MGNISEEFNNTIKNYKANFLSCLYTQKRNDYIDVLLKIVPFFKTMKNDKYTDIYKTINKNRYIIYFMLDNDLYEIEKNMEASDGSSGWSYYCINDDYEILEINLYDSIESNKKYISFQGQEGKQIMNIIGKEFIKTRNILTHPNLKNILVTKKYFEEIKQTLMYMYKHFKDVPDVFPLFDYMFTDLGVELGTKKKLVGNILNLFILTGNLNLLYSLFNDNKQTELDLVLPSMDSILVKLKEAEEELKKAEEKLKEMEEYDKQTDEELKKVKEKLSVAKYNYTISEEKIQLKKEENDKSEQIKDILLKYKFTKADLLKSKRSKNEEVEIENILLTKFKEFIKNISMDIKFTNTNIINYLNNIIYEIPEENISTINRIKTKLLILLTNANDQINGSHDFEKNPVRRLVNSYNFYDLLDNCKELDNKISSYKKGDSITDLENQFITINNIINRNYLVTNFYLLFEIVKLKLKFDRASIKLGYDNKPFIFGNYLIDIFTVFRINQEVDVPFNINLLTHDFKLERIINERTPEWTWTQSKIAKIYASLLGTETNIFINLSYGKYSRGTSDCAETVILNLINYLIWDKSSNILRYDWLPENTSEGIKKFYRTNNKFTSFNSDVRSTFNELLYGFKYIMQRDDFNDFDNYKVYSVASINENNPKKSIVEYIYDEDGVLIPGEKEIQYSGYRIRPGYSAFIRLFNTIFGFHNIDDKYNENKVMRTLTNDSLKEILLTFKNPNISNILSTYKHEYYEVEQINIITFDDISINLKWWHGTIFVKNLIKIDSVEFNDFLRRDDIRYYINHKNTNINRIIYNPEKLLSINIESLRYLIKLKVKSDLINNKEISDVIIQVYKTILAPEQSYIILNFIPSLKHLYLFHKGTSNFFNEFKGKIKLSPVIYRKIPYMNDLVFNFMVKIGNINDKLDIKGNRLIHIFVKNNLESYIENFPDETDYSLTDIMGNNILHICKYNIISLKHLEDKITRLKNILTKKTGNDQLFNKLIITKNKSGYYPIVEIHRKKNYIVDSLFPKNNLDIIKILVNSINLVKINIMEYNYKFIKILYKIIELVYVRLSDGLILEEWVNNILTMIINVYFINSIDIKYLIETLEKPIKIHEQSEIDYLKTINLYQLSETKSMELNEENITSLLTYAKKYHVFNYWLLFNKFTDNISFNRIITIFKRNGNKLLFNKIGQIKVDYLIDQIINWASKKSNYSDILLMKDENSNTIIHYLAIGYKNNFKKSNQYYNVFNRLIINRNWDLLTMTNNKGWSPIDILAYFPKYKNEVFLDNLNEIKKHFTILYNFYNTFDGDISNHKIIVLRYLIEKMFVNIKQLGKIVAYKKNIQTSQQSYTKNYNLKEVDMLINLLNQKFDDELTNQMIAKVNNEFILHEYLQQIYEKNNIVISNTSLMFSPYSISYISYYRNGKLQDPTAEDKKFNLSNKTTLNHIPVDDIKSTPNLESKQYNKLSDVNYQQPYKVLLIRKYINNFIKEKFKLDIINNREIDPTIEKIYELPEDVLPEYDESLTLATRTKYIVQGKDYNKLYLKYKQKYTNLKNKLTYNLNINNDI